MRLRDGPGGDCLHDEEVGTVKCGGNDRLAAVTADTPCLETLQTDHTADTVLLLYNN